MRFTVPFQLLEINVISAQDLAPVSRSMQTYAVAWVDPSRKLTTRVDHDGHSNPTWNEKFVFRVDDEFLNDSETSTIMVEIYSVAWLKKDTCVGHVSVLISNILPPDEKSSNMHHVTLQVRRPSGRPQGILNLDVALLDNTLRSMPLYIQPVPESIQKPDPAPPKLRRTNSDVTDLTTDPQRKASSVVNHDSISNDVPTNKNGSLLNGSVVGAPKNKGGSVVSDIGPSASVVAAAISRGIYPIHLPNNKQNDGGSLILENWNEKDNGEEGLKTKVERWRTEVPAVYDHKNDMKMGMNQKRMPSLRRRRTIGGNSLFSCFGNRIEFSITCGGAHNKKRLRSSTSDLSETTYGGSYV